MAQIVLGAGGSHGPSLQTPPEAWARLADGDTRDPRFNYGELLAAADPRLKEEVTLERQQNRYAAAQAALRELTDVILQAKLDVMVVVSNTHRVVPMQPHPVFGVFRADSFPTLSRSEEGYNPDDRFKPASERPAKGTIVVRPGRRDIGDFILGNLIENGFDVACVDGLPKDAVLDDAFTFVWDWMLRGETIPMVPMLLSRDLPNQATPRRCYDLGIALRHAIEAWPGAERIGLIASGGLSHQIVDEELDRIVVAALQSGDRATLSSLPRDRLNRGPGTPEILNWITLAGAMAPLPLTLIDYIPAYRSPASTGHGMAFGYWR
jgi:3-O-methylgallate 3,4-dioxygenase